MQAVDYTHSIELMKEKIAVHEKQLNRLTEEKNLLQLKINTLADLHVRLEKKEAELTRLGRFIKKKDPEAILTGNPHYNSLATEHEKIAAIIQKAPVTPNSKKDLQELKDRIVSVQGIIAELKTNLQKKETEYMEFQERVPEEEHAMDANLSSHTYEIPWKNVSFGNDTICIKLGGKPLSPMSFPGSRTSLNPTRDLYSFRGIPNLRLQLNGDGNWHLENIQVLTYIVHFLGFLDSFPGQSHEMNQLAKPPFSVAAYRKLDKTFYKTHLPEMFTPYYFSFLWEHAVEDLPIIPVPETVVNSGGTTEIQESFLFPLINGESAIIWILESAEDSKASLLFRTSKEKLCEELQQVFDYLVGEGSNKRAALIKNKTLAKQLGLRKRIAHKDQREWRVEVKGVLRYAEYPALL
jgi:hypothetical protein